jgi:hypothetical protein
MDTFTLLAQIAPQRSTQYSDLANQLAPHELALSPVGSIIDSMTAVTLAGQAYLKCELREELTEQHAQELGWLAMTSAFFRYYDRLADQDGPFLKPLNIEWTPSFPPDLITTRRYQGKTNELFTHFLCNLARFSSDFAQTPWNELRIFDPLCGGGTTLLVGLVLGASVAGIETHKKDARSTAVFLKQYAKEQNISYTVKDERLKKLNANRWWFTFGDDSKQRCFLAKGDTVRSPELISGFKKPHLIVADLPYGIQHKGPLQTLLSTSLPGWASLLSSGGTMAFSWDATRFSREKMIELVETENRFTVLKASPYDQLAHRVDRVIKHRDVIVACIR